MVCCLLVILLQPASLLLLVYVHYSLIYLIWYILLWNHFNLFHQYWSTGLRGGGEHTNVHTFIWLAPQQWPVLFIVNHPVGAASKEISESINTCHDVGQGDATKCRQVERLVAVVIGVCSVLVVVGFIDGVDDYATWKNVNKISENKVWSCLATTNIAVMHLFLLVLV